MPPLVSPDSPLRICIDGYNFAMPKGTGVATYGFTLAQMLRRMGHSVEGLFGLDVGKNAEIQETRFYDLLGRERQETRKQARRRAYWEKWRGVRGARVREVRIAGRVETQSFADRIPAFDRIWSAPSLFEAAHWHFRYFGSALPVSLPDPPDIMHWTYPIPIYLRGARNVYTMHDIVPLRMPHTTLDHKQLYHRIIAECVRKADRICTVSEASRSDIVAAFPYSSDKIVNTYQSSPIPCDVLNSAPQGDADIIAKLFSLRPKDYFLFFGAVDPKKNIDRLIEAYLSSKAKSPLVIVTARDWGMSGENDALSGGGLYGGAPSDRIIRLNYMPRSLLFRLIRTAKAVLMPSLLEGFGLPALEAMQLGTPVIASITGSLPEVVGDAGLLVDPYSVSAISHAIERMDTDAELRAQLVSASAAQAARFSDERYIERLTQVYAPITPG